MLLQDEGVGVGGVGNNQHLLGVVASGWVGGGIGLGLVCVCVSGWGSWVGAGVCLCHEAGERRGGWAE
jgi:hypothetical protein